jgi:hypothetical protein
VQLPEGVTEIVVNSVAVENDQGTTWLVTRGQVSRGEHVGVRVVVREPISGICGTVEFE